MKIEKVLETYGKLVDNELKKMFEKDEPKELYEPIRYHLFAGGKRVRPILCLLACESVGGELDTVLPIATGLELVHAFTLVHDDVMDEDKLRRGKSTLWSKWGKAIAINAGDGIYAKAYESALNLTVESKLKNKILKKFTDTILDVCEGQAMDVGFENKKFVSFEEYIEMATKKTASLIKTSAEVGALVGNTSEKEVNALADYGEKIGLAFQIWDDYIDFASEKTGKTFASDIKKKKKTSIVCHALENATPEQKKQLLEILETPLEETTDSKIKEAVAILNETGSIKYAGDYAKGLVDDAKKALDVLKDSDAKTALLDFADFVVEREH